MACLYTLCLQLCDQHPQGTQDVSTLLVSWVLANKATLDLLFCVLSYHFQTHHTKHITIMKYMWAVISNITVIYTTCNI